MTGKRHVAERTCCGCFAKRPVNDLLAVRRLKDGRIVVDAEGMRAGRGAYLCKNRFCLAKARDRKGRDGLSYALKVRVTKEIWDEIAKITK